MGFVDYTGVIIRDCILDKMYYLRYIGCNERDKSCGFITPLLRGMSRSFSEGCGILRFYLFLCYIKILSSFLQITERDDNVSIVNGRW